MRYLACLLLCILLFPAVSFSRVSEDPADELDRQMVFVDQTMRGIESKRAEIESQKKAEAIRRRASDKRRTEARLAVQLQGLSGRLSGLPEIPSFNGEFQENASNENVSQPS